MDQLAGPVVVKQDGNSFVRKSDDVRPAIQVEVDGPRLAQRWRPDRAFFVEFRDLLTGGGPVLEQERDLPGGDQN